MADTSKASLMAQADGFEAATARAKAYSEQMAAAAQRTQALQDVVSSSSWRTWQDQLDSQAQRAERVGLAFRNQQLAIESASGSIGRQAVEVARLNREIDQRSRQARPPELAPAHSGLANARLVDGATFAAKATLSRAAAVDSEALAKRGFAEEHRRDGGSPFSAIVRTTGDHGVHPSAFGGHAEPGRTPRASGGTSPAAIVARDEAEKTRRDTRFHHGSLQDAGGSYPRIQQEVLKASAAPERDSWGGLLLKLDEILNLLKTFSTGAVLSAPPAATE